MREKAPWDLPGSFSLPQRHLAFSQWYFATIVKPKWFFSHCVDYASSTFPLSEVKNWSTRIKYGKINMFQYF